MTTTVWVFYFLVSFLLFSTLIKAQSYDQDDEPYPMNCPGYPMARCSRVTRLCKDTEECSKGELCCVALCEIKCAKPRGNQSLPRKRRPKQRRRQKGNRKLTGRGSTTRRTSRRRRPNRRRGPNMRRRPTGRRNGTRRAGASRRKRPNRKGNGTRRRSPTRHRNGTRRLHPRSTSPTPRARTQRTTPETYEPYHKNCPGYPMARCFAPVRRYCKKTAECPHDEMCCLAFCDIRCAKARGNHSQSG